MADNDLIKDVLEAENSVLGTFQDRWDNARRNSDIYGLDHWTTAEKNKIRNQNRIPYVFDRTSHAINILLGTQRDTRFDIFFYERESSDSVKAEVANALWGYYRDCYDFKAVESDVFQDGVVGGYGVFTPEIDYNRDYRGDLKVCRVPFDEILWDLTHREYDPNVDGYWMSRMRFSRMADLIKKYPDKRELIELSGDESTWSTKRDLNRELWFKPEKDLIGTREFYEKDTVNRFLIWMKGTPEPEDFYYESKKEAEKEIRRRLELILPIASLMGEMPEFEVLPIDVPIVKKSVVLINGVLEEPKEFKMGRFPFSIFFSYFHDGDYWSVVDRHKDPQTFINRMYAQADYWIGTMAKGVLRVDPKINGKELEDIKNKFSKTGGVISAKKDQIELIESRGPAPQLFSLLDRVEGLLTDTLGGANVLGQKETASESGRAVLARQAQAGLDNFVPLDNLRRTKQNLGEMIAWILTNEITAPRKLRILGDQLSLEAMQKGGIIELGNRPNTGYLEINTTKNNTLKDVQLDIVVDEAPASVTKNLGTINQIIDAMKGGMPPPPPDVMVKLLSIPESIKQQWLASLQNQPKEPQFKGSVNYKDLPIETKMQVIEEMGFTVTPEGLATKEIIDKPQLTKKEKGAR